jgi:glutamyl-tRNA(Gln) amidotransferase subunit D
MYSKEISKLLSEKGIGVGDLIKVEYDNVSIEGELMPKTETGSPDTIIVKLKSGYNIGISFENVRLTKIASSGGEVKFPAAKLTQNGNLPKVSLLFTGGTIGSKVDYKTGGVHPLIKPEELFYDVPELSKIARIEVKNPFSIFSEDMSHKEWAMLAEEVAKELDNGARGVVIAMGTDTMHYASAALSFMLENLNSPVVITGAQRSSDRGSSDAFMNLTCAVQIAAKSDIAEVGICMHSSSSDDNCHFLRGTKARKMHSTRRDAFRPINCTPIAKISHDGSIEYTSQYKKIGNGKIKVRKGYEDKVALIKIYPGSDPKVIDLYLNQGYKGIIIEGTGLGHAPLSPANAGNSWEGHIEKAVKGGVIIGMTSQTIYGRVNPNVYSTARKIAALGVIYCEDMMPETALVKLGWLLGNHDKETAEKLLNKNLVGEISQRNELNEFLV